MKEKQILVILIVVILAILACLTTYMLIYSNYGGYATLRISNSCTIKVPNENNTVEKIGSNITRFSFATSDLNISHEKSGNNSEIKSIYTQLIKDADEIEGNIYKDKSDGLYSTFIENKNTWDALLITSKNLDVVKKVSKSVKFTKPINMDNTNTTDNTTSDIADNVTNSFSNHQSQQNHIQSNNNNNNPTPNPPSDDKSNVEPEKKKNCHILQIFQIKNWKHK